MAQPIVAAAALLLFTFSAVAGEFPGQPPDAQLLRTQQKADALFEKGDYKRAFFIHRNELAPFGDKYSQYMVGFMYLTGKGVDADPILASGWLRLAAERGREAYVKERDSLLGLFNDEQLRLSDQAYAAISAELGDRALITRLVRSDVNLLREHNQNTASDRDPIIRKTLGRNSIDVYRRASKRLAERIRFLERELDEEHSLGDQESKDLNELLSRARWELARFEETGR